ncbi:MAG TPA: DUF6220 domain-containing protein [Gaiellaceae bacterium]|nr:DUF6220 domain-containing protein [Gaiellaceae bacterium]
MQAARTIYRYWITLLWLAVVAQIAAAAYGAFYTADKLNSQSGPDEGRTVSETVFDHGFAFHTAFGYLIFVGALILLVVALLARLGRPRIWLVVAVPVAVAVQIVLAWISEAVHGVGVLHGLNALVVFGLTGYLTGEAWRARRAAPAVESVAAGA